MPIKRKPGEKKSDYMRRCIKIEMDAGKSNEQAVAICYTMAND